MSVLPRSEASFHRRGADGRSSCRLGNRRAARSPYRRSSVTATDLLVLDGFGLNPVVPPAPRTSPTSSGALRTWCYDHHFESRVLSELAPNCSTVRCSPRRHVIGSRHHAQQIRITVEVPRQGPALSPREGADERLSPRLSPCCIGFVNSGSPSMTRSQRQPAN